jgi:ribosomal protein S12 methylthiotransferase accessory factor
MGSLERSLDTASKESFLCGVTRIADITRLDFLQIHVFQAVRPWGRSLSVHQGKGLTANVAMLGAMMEAIECHCAEAFEGDQRHCAFEQLPVSERAPSILDFAVDRNQELDPAQQVNWVAALSPGGDRRLWVPFDGVSLDFTRSGDMRLDRSSNGLGARFDAEGASLKALLELVERDAVGAWWRAAPFEYRSVAQVEAASVSYDWFQDVLARARARGVFLSIYHLPSVIPLPVFRCEIFEPGAGYAPRRRSGGAGCGFSAGDALLAAVLEAAQSRLTSISGVRDDLPAPTPDFRPNCGSALPPSTHDRLARWEEIIGSAPTAPAASVVGLTESLAAAGYPDIGLVDLSRHGHDVRVVKAIVPGLGTWSRARRAAAVRVN